MKNFVLLISIEIVRKLYKTFLLLILFCCIMFVVVDCFFVRPSKKWIAYSRAMNQVNYPDESVEGNVESIGIKHHRKLLWCLLFFKFKYILVCKFHFGYFIWNQQNCFKNHWIDPQCTQKCAIIKLICQLSNIVRRSGLINRKVEQRINLNI